MTMKALLYTLLIFILFSCSQERTDDRIDSIDKFMQGQFEFFNFNGNILVAEKGKVIYKKSFGMADFTTNRPLNDSTMFELCSVSKQFTAAAILILENQGKLSLRDSLRMYFPEFPYSNITVEHLLTHTSGLPDHEKLMINPDNWDQTKISFNDDVINFLANTKPSVNFEPGEKYEYSNTAYVLLASIVERVSGMTFKDFMAKNIFEPLGMKHSRVYNTIRSGEKINNYALGYVWSNRHNRFVLPDSLSVYHFAYVFDGNMGDGYVSSTTTDLLKWDRALYNKTLLGEEGTKKMLSPHTLMDTVSNLSYGYGVRIGNDNFGQFITHSGGWPGYRTFLARYVKEDITIIVLSNDEANSNMIHNTLVNIMHRQPIDYAYEHKSTKLESSGLNLFLGTFTPVDKTNLLPPRGDFTISTKSDSLFFNTGLILLPESDSKIFSVKPKFRDIQFEVVNENGDTKYYLSRYGIKSELKKIR